MQVKNIPMTDIVTSELNPRKTFDQEEIQELAQSIKENGLVQPITLRKKAKDKYEIVCGERRFRACQLLGEKSIQAIVKDLSDKQAFACMIIENLQRKDIDPMEEAAALYRLSSEGSMTVAEMAKMLGKSTSFVLGRIQLYNTIPEFVELMKNGPLVLTHLLDICKLTKEQQKILYDNCFTEECRSRWKYKFPNMPQLHEMIDEHVMNYLSEARFSLADESFEFAPACENCPLNTKNNPDSFKDVNSPRCMKRKCFMQKTRESIFRAAKEINTTSDGKVPIVFHGEYSESESILQSAEAYGLDVIGVGRQQYVIPPTEPNKDAFQDAETYERRYANYEKAKAVFDDNIKDGTVTQVFEICYSGHLSGETKYLFVMPDSQEEPLITRQIEDSRKRISELKTKLHECGDKYREEQTEKQRAFMEVSEYSNLNTELSPIEMQIFYALITKRLPVAFKERVGIGAVQSNDYRKAKKLIQENLNAIFREFIRVALSEKSVNFSKDLATMLDAIMGERYSNMVDEITKGLDSRYGALKSNIQAKIDEIRQSEMASELRSSKPKEPMAQETKDEPQEPAVVSEENSQETASSEEEIPIPAETADANVENQDEDTSESSEEKQ